MRRMLLAALLAWVGACGDDTAPGSLRDLSTCGPLTAANQNCPLCDPGASAPCGSEQEGFQCHYDGTVAGYCVCHSGRWSCAGQPFGVPDLALPRD